MSFSDEEKRREKKTKQKDDDDDDGMNAAAQNRLARQLRETSGGGARANRIIGDIYGNSRRNRCVSGADAVINNGAINLAARRMPNILRGSPNAVRRGDAPIGSS